MLEYLYLLRGQGGLELAGWKMPSLPVSLAILNGLFVFLYVTLKFIGDSPVGAGMTVFLLLAMLAANGVVYVLLTSPF